MNYIKSARDLANELDCDIVIRPHTDEQGFGFVFSSNDYVSFSRFRLAMFGDCPNPGQFRHTHRFVDVYANYVAQWQSTVREILDRRDIPFTCHQEDNNTLIYCFDRPSHAALLFYAIDSGLIHEYVTNNASHPDKELKLDYFRPLFKTPGYSKLLQFAKK